MSMCSCCLSNNPNNAHRLQGCEKLLKYIRIKIYSPAHESIVCSSCYAQLKRLKKFADRMKAAQSFIKILKNRTEHDKSMQIEKPIDIDVKIQEIKCNDSSKCCPVAQADVEIAHTGKYEPILDAKQNYNKNELQNQNRRKSKLGKYLPYKLDRNSRTCPVCDQQFIFFKELSDHVPSHYPAHICDMCGKLCATRLSLKNHIKSHYEPTSKCEECGKLYKRLSSLRDHIQTTHKGQKRTYKCVECLETFKTFNERVVHLISVHGREEKRYRCKECPKRYNHGSHLRAHIRNEHRKEKNVECEECHFTFFNNSALKKHLVSHSKDKKYQCIQCSKFYPRKSALNLHLKIHANLKAFACSVCERTFTQKVSLNKHLRTHEKTRTQSAVNDLSIMLQKL